MFSHKAMKWSLLTKRVLCALLAIWMLSAVGSVVLAQDAEPKGPPSTFFDYWDMAGPTKWALVGSAVWCTALLIEILIRVRFKVFCPPEIVQPLTQSLLVKDYTKAWKFCMDNPSPISRMMSAGIEKITKGEAAVKEAILDASDIEFDKFKVKNSYLNLNATVNTLLGLFGTISGMIGAFNKMAYAGATGDPAKLAGDIGEALIVTWTGLGIAIVAMYLFYILTNRLKAVIAQVQLLITSLLDYIKFEEITPDMVIVPAEMRAEYSGGGSGSSAAVAAGPSRTPTPAAAGVRKPAAETIACPSCGKNITVGAKQCPHCQTDIEWE